MKGRNEAVARCPGPGPVHAGCSASASTTVKRSVFLLLLLASMTAPTLVSSLTISRYHHGNTVGTGRGRPIARCKRVDSEVDGTVETTRRNVLRVTATALASTATATVTQLLSPIVLQANAFSFGKTEHRQLELCLVAMLRLRFWAESTEYKLRNAPTEDARKAAYLEARLGAKAVVSGKIGGGASGRVFALNGLQIKDCLADLRYYAKNRRMDQLSTDLLESLASIVEFDGLETTQDPSPRSSLTLSMYSSDKATYVARMIGERIDPMIDSILQEFPADARSTSQEYALQYYASEMPPNRQSST